jgi:putative transposase
VQAGLVAPAADWPWSSVGAHIAGRSSPHVSVDPALTRIADVAGFAAVDADDQARWTAVLKSGPTGRPVGARTWIGTLETRLGRLLSPQRRGPKPRRTGDTEGDRRELMGI